MTNAISKYKVCQRALSRAFQEIELCIQHIGHARTESSCFNTNDDNDHRGDADDEDHHSDTDDNDVHNECGDLPEFSEDILYVCSLDRCHRKPYEGWTRYKRHVESHVEVSETCSYCGKIATTVSALVAHDHSCPTIREMQRDPKHKRTITAIAKRRKAAFSKATDVARRSVRQNTVKRRMLEDGRTSTKKARTVDNLPEPESCSRQAPDELISGDQLIDVSHTTGASTILTNQYVPDNAYQQPIEQRTTIEDSSSIPYETDISSSNIGIGHSGSMGISQARNDIGTAQVFSSIIMRGSSFQDYTLDGTALYFPDSTQDPTEDQDMHRHLYPGSNRHIALSDSAVVTQPSSTTMDKRTSNFHYPLDNN